MRSLITGASGFIGSHLAAHLAASGHDVTVLVRSTSRKDDLTAAGLHFALGDIRDAASLRAAVRGMANVFHLGAVFSAPDRETYFAVNTQGTVNLLEACRAENPGLRRFVFVSSISAAGPSPAGAALDEDAPSRPVSDYGRSKLAAEEAVLAAGRALPVTVIRPPNVLGPRQRELVESIKLLGRKIKPLIGRRNSRTSIAAVADIVRALALVAEDPRSVGRVYYVTDGRVYTWREITDTIAAAVGLGRFYLPIPFPAQYAVAAAAEAVAGIRGSVPLVSRDHVRAVRRYDWVFDSSRIGRELGFRPSMDMAAAVRAAVDAFRSGGEA